MVAPATLVLIQQNVRVLRRNDPAVPKLRIGKGVANSFAQLLVYPLLNRNAETLFWTSKNLFRDQVGYGAFEQVLRFQTRHLHRSRNAGHKVDELMIKERHARL